MHIDPNHKSGNSALDKACAQIGETFRQERKDRQSVILQGHRVQALVEAKRYSFPEACRLMQVDAKQVNDALAWLIDDNAGLNARFETDINYQQPHDYTMSGWFMDQHEQMQTAQIINIRGAA